MAEVTRSQFAGAIRDRFGVDPSADRDLIGRLWDRYGPDDSAELDDLVSLAEPVVVEVLRDRQKRGYLGGEGSTRLGASPGTTFLGGASPGGNGLATLSEGREWVGRRLSAFSEYLSRILAVDEGVIGFRKRALGSPTATLTPEQAARVVHSPAAAYLPFAFFESHGVSLTDHEATIEHHEIASEAGGTSYCATIGVKSAGRAETIRSVVPSQGAMEVLYWPGQGNGAVVERIDLRNDSVLGELRALGKRLSDRHPWQQDQAINFVLTGAPQLASTLQGGIRSSFNNGVKAHKYDSNTIVLEAEYWVPADEVARAYRKLQREAHGGKEKRKSSDCNIEVFRHVVHLSDVKIVSADENLAKLVIPTWRDMLKRWNKEYPAGTAWHYEDETGQGAKRFQRDYKRGQREVTGRDTGLPGERDSP